MAKSGDGCKHFLSFYKKKKIFLVKKEGNTSGRLYPAEIFRRLEDINDVATDVFMAQYPRLGAQMVNIPY